ncbi:helix-turn-helix domain-containing protein [Bacillus toyonensis]|uniref:helix-turn-helix domain-containing protein n=1 Tax=Bacillus toyonensis TaxID=155322 RepID=UPI000BF17529|nr:XRE family transcriptional regulator [Bacillus toyonensis]PEJ98785.1 XRE family transcriptional regulator [Bacillus toyonensis]PEK85054.1 XRE family transcriptional regulator [Bacillus toyonensis]PEL24673.1 XRE family transcriptional regulator [Bacillus toyonensis]PEO42840.1 XRE family transcriptional regulator [Bacillus toyonensis]PFY35914.1 XRE family transcriptional regulator [Bacillus toyonensis]
MKQDISKYVGQQIKNFRKLKKMTQKELGLRIGKKHNTISSYENGTNEPEQDVLFAIAQALDISINDLFPPTNEVYKTNTPTISLLSESTYTYVPTSISAGLPLEIDGMTEMDLETIHIPDALMGKWAGREDIFMTRVNGDSMNKVIPHTSLIAVKKVVLEELYDNDIVVFSNGCDYSVKRFFNDKENKRVIFRPDSYDNRFFDYTVSYEDAANIKIHGKVVMYMATLD